MSHSLPPDKLNRAISELESALSDMQQCLIARKWDRLSRCEKRVSGCAGDLEQLLAAGDAASAAPEIPMRLKSLSQVQRRVMRLLSVRMQSVAEDISSLDQGIRRLRGISRESL